MAYRSSAPRSAVPIGVALTLVAVFCAGVGLGQLTGLPSLPSLWGTGSGADGAALRRSLPTQISIASLGVRASVVEVGQARDGSIAAPSGDPVATTGWYRASSTPGERGTAVIVGHVDTSEQPAVFHRLRELRRGKLIEVTRHDRRVAAFTVESVSTYPKTAFPVDDVFANAGRPRLVLVTCGGRWLGGDLGYADNVIVFATLA